MTIVIATRNKGKVKELAKLLGDGDQYVFKSLDDFEELSNLEIEETGQTYEHNAALKAKIVAEKTNHVAIADDSGLEVKSLDNFPGINSARWMPGSDQERNRGLLKKLSGAKTRSAQFVAALCLYDPETKFESCVKGVLKGKIAQSPHGNNGFGYDPIFIPNGFNQTLAELGQETKDKISHRSVAAEKLDQLLTKKYGKLEASD